MNLLAVCPKDKNHKRFSTTAYVCEEWLVDEHGEFMNKLELLEVTHDPDPDNTWTCAECGSEAEVKEIK